MASKKDQKEEEEELDDDRTLISKNVSWILRRGARQAGVKQDSTTKWVKFTDLCKASVLKDYTPELIWQVIVDFNGKKLRYEINDADPNDKYIRAYKREQRKMLEGGAAVPGATSRPEGAGLSRDASEFVPSMNSQSTPTAATAAAAQAQFQQQAAAFAAAAYNPYFGYPMMPFMNPLMWQQQMQQQQQQQQQGGASSKFQGWIKSFSTEKGFGFIQCDATYAQYTRDVFLHKAQIGDLEVGSHVQFSCEVNKNGMPQAKDVQPLGGPLQQTSPTAGGKSGGKGGKDGGKGKAAGKGKGKGEKGEKGKKGGKGGKGGKEKKDSADKEDDDAAAAEGGAEAPAAAAPEAPAASTEAAEPDAS